MNFPRVIEWKDKESTGAKGWIVIDSLSHGVASGGIFMHMDTTLKEVTDLAKTMSYKNALQEPRVGGAKGGIKFDHTHPEAKNVLRRFIIDNKYYIEKFWSTGADLNTNNDLIHKIICQELHIPSGFVSVGNMLSRFYNIKDQSGVFLDRILQPVPPCFTLGRCATGYSVATCISHFCTPDTRLVIQGWGNVGRSAAYFIQKKKKTKIIGIIEKDYFVYHKEELDISYLLLSNADYDLLKLASHRYTIIHRTPGQADETFLAFCLSMVSADIFCPCATRYAITELVARTLLEHTFKGKLRKSWVISGANNVFSNEQVIFQLDNAGVNLLPEWISNSGNTLLYNKILTKEIFIYLTEECLLSIKRSIKSFLREALFNCEYAQQSLYERCYDLIEKKIGSSNVKCKRVKVSL